MELKDFNQVEEYLNALNDLAFEGTIELLLDWMEEKGIKLPDSKKVMIAETTKGFKLMRSEIGKEVLVNLGKTSDIGA